MVINIGDVIDGALVNAIALAGRRVSIAAGALHGRRPADDVSVARWFETYTLTGAPPDLPGLSEDMTQRLAGVLAGDDFQAALQELLAARLTDAAETYASAARQVLTVTLISAVADVGPVANALAGYYDDQVCALVGRLEGDDPPLLTQIRSDAFSTRMINVLNAIERHTAALTSRPAPRTEASFLTAYRRHVVVQHGKLEPPDFDRRRRVPIAHIYVPTLITEDPPPGRTAVTRSGTQTPFDVYGLAAKIDRSVLLGDPGGGKTTAAHVLMHHFASDPGRRVPFLVTLRSYASGGAPHNSVVGYIEHVLDTFYQISPPPGLVELLLLTGRAVVIFDGLDELLDTGWRADVTSRVENFCVEYPLVPVLVTSRVVGYDQARLDDREFTCYRLGGFGDIEVTDYARKWFRQDSGSRPGDADTFLTESESIRDLRSNPLLLSLLCILYRGEGSLPRNRAEVYEQCANLLFRRWDARRGIHVELRAGNLVEPALRNLAWWLFAQDRPQPTIAEHQLVDVSAQFLHERGFEAEDDARAAAGEFVEFYRGRMWVFTDVGTTSAGERLYAFTHRTFLEYFAAAQIAYRNDRPEDLASALVPYIASKDSWVVAELALQIKDRSSDRGAPRIYAALLKERRSRSPVTLQFLALCLRSADPSPQHVRELTRQLFTATCAPGLDMNQDSSLRSAWRELMAHCGSYRGVIADEIDAALVRVVGAGREDLTVSSLHLILSLPDALPLSPRPGGQLDRDAWASQARSLLLAHGPAAIAAARTDGVVRLGAIRAGLISVRQALDMPGGPTVLFRPAQGVFREYPSYFGLVLTALDRGWPAFGQAGVVADLEALGAYLMDQHEPPWLDAAALDASNPLLDTETRPGAFDRRPPPLSQAAYLGAAVLLLATNETRLLTARSGRRLGPLSHLAPYLARRLGPGRRTELPSLMVPEEFKQAFRDWAEGRIDVTRH
jgi:NACHT domain-containing protein